MYQKLLSFHIQQFSQFFYINLHVDNNKILPHFILQLIFFFFSFFFTKMINKYHVIFDDIIHDYHVYIYIQKLSANYSFYIMLLIFKKGIQKLLNTLYK